VPRTDFRMGVPCAGYWRELFNSDAREYGGGGIGNSGGLEALGTPCHGRAFSINALLPPLAAVVFRSP
jgi:1,4-alpha-glucan branching enzyme